MALTVKNSFNVNYELYFASSNSHKTRELKTILKEYCIDFAEAKGFNISLFDINDLNVKNEKMENRFSPKETGKTFAENAYIKASFLAKLLPNKNNKMIISEDSGLVVPALKGAPGIFSSRYGKNDNERICRLLKEMKKISNKERKAYFFTCICFLDYGLNPIYFQSKVWGEILTEPRGSNGFGYDPIFYLSELKKSFAELTIEEKSQFSHRKKAFYRLIGAVTCP